MFTVAAGDGLVQDADGLSHADTSTLTGVQGTQGIATITVDGMGHVTAVTTATYTRKYTELLSTSATAYVITHNLGTQDASVTVREALNTNITPNFFNYKQVMCDVEFTSTNTITLRFNTAPAANTYKVTVVG